MSTAIHAGHRTPNTPYRGLRRAGMIGAAFLSAGVALVSYRYLAGLGLAPPNIASNRFARPWIVIHAASAATALLVGPLQLFPALGRRGSRVHRSLGHAYVLGCAIGSLSAMVLAAGTAEGPIAAAGFYTLDLYWIAATALGVTSAMRGRYAAHRRWMLRSLALTFGAVMLRLYLPVGTLLGLDFHLTYRAVSWLAWVPNALLAELYLQRASTFRA